MVGSIISRTGRSRLCTLPPACTAPSAGSRHRPSPGNDVPARGTRRADDRTTSSGSRRRIQEDTCACRRGNHPGRHTSQTRGSRPPPPRRRHLPCENRSPLPYSASTCGNRRRCEARIPRPDDSGTSRRTHTPPGIADPIDASTPREGSSASRQQGRGSPIRCSHPKPARAAGACGRLGRRPP